MTEVNGRELLRRALIDQVGNCQTFAHSNPFQLIPEILSSAAGCSYGKHNRESDDDSA